MDNELSELIAQNSRLEQEILDMITKLKEGYDKILKNISEIKNLTEV